MKILFFFSFLIFSVLAQVKGQETGADCLEIGEESLVVVDKEQVDEFLRIVLGVSQSELDISTQKRLQATLGRTFGVGYSRLKNNFEYGANLSLTKVTEDDLNSPETSRYPRGANFRSDILALMGFVRYQFKFDEDAKLYPFIQADFGGLVTTNVDLNDPLNFIDPDEKIDDDHVFSISYGLGLGAKYELNDKYTLELKANKVWAAHDKIDNFGMDLPGPEGDQRNDAWETLTIGITKRLFEKEQFLVRRKPGSK